MPTGTVKKVVNDRGFGFIAAEDGKEYFFHRSGLDTSLNFDALAGGESVGFHHHAVAERRQRFARLLDAVHDGEPRGRDTVAFHEALRERLARTDPFRSTPQ